MTIDHFPSPMIFAHRGVSAYSPENTLPAFNLAGEQGADGIELDVKLCADGEVVVLHDQSVDRTTNGHGDLRSFTLSQLKKLDAGYKYAHLFPNTRIPTLREVFEVVSEKLYLNIELTNYASPQDDLVIRVISLVRQYNRENVVLFSSFNPFTLHRAKTLCPEIPVGLLLMPTLPNWFGIHVFAPLLKCEAIHPYFPSVTLSLVEDAHRQNRRVHSWTVNHEKDMLQLRQAGVDGIFTDDPLLGLEHFCQ